jgi:hypothetical protein
LNGALLLYPDADHLSTDIFKKIKIFSKLFFPRKNAPPSASASGGAFSTF